jgi:hypothetical protein
VQHNRDTLRGSPSTVPLVCVCVYEFLFSSATVEMAW